MSKTALLSLIGVALMVAPVWAQGRRGASERGRRGFDTDSFLTRLDANKNGILEPDEQQGPAKFLIRRVQSIDSSIKPESPVPIDKLQAAYQTWKENRSSGQEQNGQRDDSKQRREASSHSSEKINEALTPKLLVPGFGDESDDAGNVLGFGATAELLSSEVTQADRVEAARRMSQFDRDRDGFLAKSEITRNFAGNPFDFDRNRDGRLSVDELAVRYARRRIATEEKRSDQAKNQTEREEKREPPQIFGDRKSYRPLSKSAEDENEGVPGFLIDKDADGDGQVTMAEYSQEWTDELLAKFFEADFNRDGVITFAEGLRMVEEGPATQSSASTTGSTSQASTSQASGSPAAAGPINPKHLALAQRIIKRRDKNNDGALTASEWKSMLISPVAADTNRDGKITPQEYARWTRSRELGR